MIVNSRIISPRVASVVAHVCYQSDTIISVSRARVLQLCFKKLFYSEIKLAISAALESGQNTSGALSILNSSGASPGATEKVAALVARATCSGASHSSAYAAPKKCINLYYRPNNRTCLQSAMYKFCNITSFILPRRKIKNINNISLEFIMLTDNNQILRNCFVIIYCHLTKVITQINKCIIFEPNELSITQSLMEGKSLCILLLIYKKQNNLKNIYSGKIYIYFFLFYSLFRLDGEKINIF